MLEYVFEQIPERCPIPLLVCEHYRQQLAEEGCIVTLESKLAVPKLLLLTPEYLITLLIVAAFRGDLREVLLARQHLKYHHTA